MKTLVYKGKSITTVALILGFLLPGLAMADNRHRDDDRGGKYLRGSVHQHQSSRHHNRHMRDRGYLKHHANRKGHDYHRKYGHHDHVRYGYPVRHPHHAPRYHEHVHVYEKHHRHYDDGVRGKIRYDAGDVTIVYRW